MDEGPDPSQFGGLEEPRTPRGGVVDVCRESNYAHPVFLMREHCLARIDMQDRWMTLQEVVEYLQLSNDQVYRLAQSRKIPASKVRNRWRFRQQAIDRWMEDLVDDSETVVTGKTHWSTRKNDIRNATQRTQMRFIDLFAGLGGFHLALENLGHKCVFASEIDETLRETYYKNFGMSAFGDIREVAVESIPSHDILCAGFPCQPFSKARDHSEPEDPELSELYLQILRVIRYHHPRFLILENVPNFERHENGQTWDRVRELLEGEGYSIRLAKLSPHEFGIPQIRHRIYIIGSRSSLSQFEWPTKSRTNVSINSVLDSHPRDSRQVPERVRQCLDIWQEFLDLVPKGEKIPHPLWSMEFGATYCYEDTTPWVTDTDILRTQRGSHGRSLYRATTKEHMLDILPSHARTKQAVFPDWKVGFIRQNREFYSRHKNWLDSWMEKIKVFPSSFQKLEWNCQERNPKKEVRQIRDYVIQIRASGVRVKRNTTAPSLVAMTATQVPIIGWEERYMTPLECKRLQSMDGLELPQKDTKAYSALGNAINVKVAQLVAEALLRSDDWQAAEPPEPLDWIPEPVRHSLMAASNEDQLATVTARSA